jgi:NADPH-dependent curcumin reductase CurA
MNALTTYSSSIAVGDVMEGEAIAGVVESRNPHYNIGDIVHAQPGWRSHAALGPRQVYPLESSRAPLTTSLGVLGTPCFTAFSGMRVIARPQPGETIVVAAAAGAVGSLGGQLAIAIRMRSHRWPTPPTRTCAMVQTVARREQAFSSDINSELLFSTNPF